MLRLRPRIPPSPQRCILPRLVSTRRQLSRHDNAEKDRLTLRNPLLYTPPVSQPVYSVISRNGFKKHFNNHPDRSNLIKRCCNYLLGEKLVYSRTLTVFNGCYLIFSLPIPLFWASFRLNPDICEID